MKKLIILLFVSVLLLSSCVSEKVKEAAGVAAAMSGAQDYTITKSKSAGTGGSHSDLVITLQKLVSKDANEKIASASALNIFGMLSKEDYKDFDRIKIIIERDDATYEQTFEIKKLAMTAPILKNIQSIFSKDSANNYNIPPALIDPQLIRDSSVQQFARILTLMETNYGRLSDVSITGFSYDTVKDIDRDILIAKVKATNGSMECNYTFYFSFESKKIIFIGVNQG